MLAEPSTHLTLLQRANRGDSSAWKRMVQIYSPLVYSWARRGGLQSADAADVVQETMASVSRDLEKYDPDVASGKFRGWLRTITRRRIADLLRSADEAATMGSQAGHLVDDVENLQLDEEETDTGGVLQRAVLVYRDRYDSKTWRAFWMTVVEGRPIDATAEQLGLSKWAIYKARSRILHRLRRDLSDLENFAPPSEP